jgi:hypothetical protein
MKKSIDASSVATRVMMTRASAPGAVMLVEGDTDARFFGNLTHGTVVVVTAQGKDNVLGALATLAKWRVAGVLAIVDADYWTLEASPAAEVLVTDSHDTETLILASPALTKVVREFLSGDSLSTVEALVEQLREALLAAGEPFGCLRWVSDREGLWLNFSLVEPCEFVDSSDLSVRRDALIRRVRETTGGRVTLSDGELDARGGALQAKKRDRWLVCQGHDLVRLRSRVLPVVLDRRGETEAGERARYVTSATLGRQLRLAYETRFFRKTKLYAAIRGWESRNPKYAVLARDE